MKRSDFKFCEAEKEVDKAVKQKKRSDSLQVKLTDSNGTEICVLFALYRVDLSLNLRFVIDAQMALK